MTEATLMACPSLRHASEQPCSDNCAVHYMVKAVNAHDALVAALVCAEADLEGLVSESEQDDHPAWQTLKEIRTALGAAK